MNTSPPNTSLPPRPTLVDWLLLGGLVVAYGTSFAMSKIALRDFAPEWIAAARLAIGAAVLGTVALLQRSPIPRDRRSIASFLWLGLVGNAAPFFVITWGMKFIPSGVAGLLMGTIPLIVIVMAHFLLPGEKLNLQRVTGFLLGFAGIVVLMGPENLLNFKAHGQELLGELAVVSGCLMYATSSVSAKLLKLRGTVAMSAGVLTAGAVLATANALLQSPVPSLAVQPSSLLALFGLGLLPTGIATVIWFKAVERTSPTFSSMNNYLVPVYALVFGAITLGEQIHWNVAVALLLVLTGIFISRMRPMSKPA